MESEAQGTAGDAVDPHEALERLEVARRAGEAAARRASSPWWFILATALYTGFTAVSAAYETVGLVVIGVTGAAFAILIGIAVSQARRVRFGQLGAASWTFGVLAFAIWLSGFLVSLVVASVAVGWVLGVIVTVGCGASLVASNAAYRRHAARDWAL